MSAATAPNAGDAWLGYLAARDTWNAVHTPESRRRLVEALRAFSVSMGGEEKDHADAVAHLEATLDREAGLSQQRSAAA